MNENEIVNAKITSTKLGYEDHGIMTCWLFLEGNGWGGGFGGYGLDDYDKEKERRVATAQGLEAIIQLMKALDVENWENLKGKYIRCEIGKIGGGRGVTKVGHLIKDQWFSFEEFFNKEKENE